MFSVLCFHKLCTIVSLSIIVKYVVYCHEVLLPDCNSYLLLSILIAGHDSNSFDHSDWILYSRGECKKTHTHKLVVLPLGMFQGGYRITLTHHQGKEELNDSFMTTTAEDYER